MVEFVVTVPEDTPGPVFLAGDGPVLGDWSAAGVLLDWCADNTYRATLDLPPGFRGRFLITRGRWREAENDGDGRELLPRELHVDSLRTREVHVRGWGRNSIDYHTDYVSHFLLHPRTVSVWRPPGYDREPERLPVFYMHDGQNLFDAHTAFAGNPWRADEVAEREVRAGRVLPIMIVGVANTPDRVEEYGPRREPTQDRSRDYGRFLVEELKPFIDACYRTRSEPEHTGIGGSSMGGLISLHLCQWYPDVFGRCAAMSPSLWWDREYFLRSLKRSPEWLNRCRVWLDVGDRESGTRSDADATLRRVRRLAQIFARHGLREGEQFRHLEVPGATHNEAAWSSRFDQVLRFLFGK